jgi:hypothetical protein
MSDRDIQDALNEGMLKSAQAAAKSREYSEALEDIFSVLALDEGCTRAHLVFLETALLLLGEPALQSRLFAAEELPTFVARISTLTSKLHDLAFLVFANLVSYDVKVRVPDIMMRGLLDLSRWVFNDELSPALSKEFIGGAASVSLENEFRGNLDYGTVPAITGVIENYDVNVAAWKALRDLARDDFAFIRAAMEIAYRRLVNRAGKDKARVLLQNFLVGLESNRLLSEAWEPAGDKKGIVEK